MTVGTVTLSLADIDSLRDKIKEAEKKAADIEKELLEVKADKRIMKVTKPIKDKNFTYSLDMERLSRDYNYRPFDLITRLKEYLTIYPIMDLDDKPEFINFDDVKAELRKILEKEYAEELGELRSSQKRYTQQLSEKDVDNQAKIAEIRKETEKQLKQQNEIISDWEKRYDDLEKDKKEKSEIATLNDLIKTLEAKLWAEKNKPWWKKLISK